MPFVATWVGPEMITLGWPKSSFEFSYKFQKALNELLVNPVLREVSQTEKDKYHMISLIHESKIWHK